MDISGRPPLQHGSFVSINTEDMWPGPGTARIKEPFYYSSLFTYASRSNIKDYFSCPQSMCMWSLASCYNCTIATWTFRTKQYCCGTTNPDVGSNVTVKVMSCV